jgi:hypothetical protein
LFSFHGYTREELAAISMVYVHHIPLPWSALAGRADREADDGNGAASIESLAAMVVRFLDKMIEVRKLNQ